MLSCEVMRRNQQQLAALPIPGGWKWETIELAGQAWRMLLPADGAALISAAVKEEEWPDPFWAEIWPAAKSLAALILQRAWPQGTKVLEVGCGSGLVGLAAVARGCWVTFSDYVPMAVELAVANARGNGFLQAGGQVLDWRLPVADEKFDVILAADVLYDPDLNLPLLDTVSQLLRPGGSAWLGDPMRSEWSEVFVSLARDRGWIVTLSDETGKPCESCCRGEFRLLELHR